MKENREDIIEEIRATFHERPVTVFYGYHAERMWIQVGMERPDCDRPEKVEIGKGGKEYISQYATEDEIVKKIFGLCMRFVEHELREGFYYKGKRVFGPHISMQALMSVSDLIVGREEV